MRTPLLIVLVASLGAVPVGGCGYEPESSLLFRGMQKSAAGDHAGALVLLDRAVAQSPNDASLLVVRGGVHEMVGDPASAVADYERAIALAPELAPGLTEQLAYLREQAGAEPVPSTAGGPEISHVTFCSAMPVGYREYAAQPDARYRPGDTVWIYLDVDGLRSRSRGEDGVENAFRQRLRLTDPAGTVLIDEIVLDDVNSELEQLFLHNRIEVPKHAPAGAYRVDFVVEDRLAGATGAADAQFVIER